MLNATIRNNTGQRTTGLSRIFGVSTLEESPNWRLQIANQLAEEANGEPPTHEDPWIEDTAQLLYAGLQGDRDYEITVRQWHIAQALQLNKIGQLAITVVQARLAAKQSPEEIATKCNIDRDTIVAYATLLCDVSDHRRFQTYWRQRLFAQLNMDKHVGTIATILHNRVMLGGSEALEEAVGVLCRLEGSTMADGLPDRDSPGFAREFGIRGGFAQSMLPVNKTNARLMNRFEEARRGEAPGDPMCDEAVDIGLEILRKVKIPKQLRTEIARLRANSTPMSGTAATGDDGAEILAGAE